MASLFFSVFSIAVLLLNLSSLVQSRRQIVTYWGQSILEGSLESACSTGRYETVNIGFLNVFGLGQEPSLDLADHCDTQPCTDLSKDIKSCQKQDVRVLLSIGGPGGRYSLGSPAEARDFATYLWNNFLGGASDSRPLGDAILNGIDFHIVSGGVLYWDDLVRALNEFQSQRPIVLSASPRCTFPDLHLNTAIQTGLFNWVSAQFYNNEECQYTVDATLLLASWTIWTVPDTTELLLGLPAAPEAARGYIPIDVLTSQVLPRVKSFDKYGGVMLWNRLYDEQTDYGNGFIA